MVKLLLFLNIFSGVWFYFNKIQNSNTLKRQAVYEYKDHFYSHAADLFDELLVTYDPLSENIKINLAHSCFKAQNYTGAIKYYTELLTASDVTIRSIAQCQLGVIQNHTKRYKLALFYFKEALRTNPQNTVASYNYELLKVKLRKEEDAGKKGNSSNDKGSRKPSGQRNLSEDNQYNAEGDKEADLFHSSLYQQQNLSKQRAEKILEYLQELEIQYYHQIQKHVPEDSHKPDW
jgi:tetratricopeptide (TPR) repeat protein